MLVSKWHLSVVWDNNHLPVSALGTNYLGRAREEQVPISGDELGLPATSKKKKKKKASTAGRDCYSCTG